VNSYLLLFISVFAGGLIGYLLHSHRSVYVKVLLTFSGGYLLSIAVFHLLPEIYEVHNHFFGVWIMAGFFLQLVLEFMSRGMEHGHAHTELFRDKVLPFTLLAGLFIHALLESLPIGAHSNEVSRNAFLWAIVIHKLPVSIILYAMLSELTSNKWIILAWMAAFALIAPLGTWFGTQLTFLHEYYRELNALVLGMFLHISTTILFESNQSHRFNFAKFITVIVASTIAWFSVAHH